MSTTRSGDMVSAQIGRMGIIDLQENNFSLADGQSFNIKNDGENPVTLEVRLASMTDFIETIFEPGWNPEIVREVKQTNLQGSNLKFGY